MVNTVVSIKDLSIFRSCVQSAKKCVVYDLLTHLVNSVRRCIVCKAWALDTFLIMWKFYLMIICMIHWVKIYILFILFLTTCWLSQFNAVVLYRSTASYVPPIAYISSVSQNGVCVVWISTFNLLSIIFRQVYSIANNFNQLLTIFFIICNRFFSWILVLVMVINVKKKTPPYPNKKKSFDILFYFLNTDMFF